MLAFQAAASANACRSLRSTAVATLMDAIHDDACLAACRAAFLADVAAALGKSQVDQTTGRSVYAQNASKLANCLNNAATNHIKAIKAALNRYQVCIDGCGSEN